MSWPEALVLIVAIVAVAAVFYRDGSLAMKPSKYIRFYFWRTSKKADGWHRFGAWPDSQSLRVHTPVLSLHISWARRREFDYCGLASDPRLFRWVK